VHKRSSEDEKWEGHCCNASWMAKAELNAWICACNNCPTASGLASKVVISSPKSSLVLH
jgi:hypothetical protein